MYFIGTQAMDMASFAGERIYSSTFHRDTVILVLSWTLLIIMLLSVIALTITLTIFLRHLMKHHFKKTDS